MTYRDILVHVPLQNFEGQIEVAVALAKDFSAHLTGICSLPETAMLLLVEIERRIAASLS